VADNVWLAATWPFVRDHLGAAPARVLELGCGPLGGFIPRMRALGYDAVGVDLHAPGGPGYDQGCFEDYRVREPLDAFVACTSLHHVTDLNAVLDQIESVLRPGGTIVVVEWAHERFDEATARWCFDRVAPDGDGWLQHHRDRWRESGLDWDRYFREWTSAEGLHPGGDIVRSLQSRFDTVVVAEGPLLFADLDGVTRDEEHAAIATGVIRANGLHYVGHSRARASATASGQQ
jgi:SAM-dependent methyltransferase